MHAITCQDLLGCSPEDVIVLRALKTELRLVPSLFRFSGREPPGKGSASRASPQPSDWRAFVRVAVQ